MLRVGLVLAALVLMVTPGVAQRGPMRPPQNEEPPAVLVREPMFNAILAEHFPQLSRQEYYFDNLRPAPWTEDNHRWFYEMRDCLKDEGFEIRDYLRLEHVQLYLFDEGWSLARSRGSELDGGWFVKYIILDGALGAVLHEITMRHEFVHHFIGLTHHPLTEEEVGECRPNIMLDRLKDAKPTRSRRTFSSRSWRLHR